MKSLPSVRHRYYVQGGRDTYLLLRNADAKLADLSIHTISQCSPQLDDGFLARQPTVAEITAKTTSATASRMVVSPPRLYQIIR